jgi:hypothetical protein
MARQVALMDALHDHNEDAMILIIKRDGSDSSQNRSVLPLSTSLARPISRTFVRVIENDDVGIKCPSDFAMQ